MSEEDGMVWKMSVALGIFTIVRDGDGATNDGVIPRWHWERRDNDSTFSSSCLEDGSRAVEGVVVCMKIYLSNQQ